MYRSSLREKVPGSRAGAHSVNPGDCLASSSVIFRADDLLVIFCNKDYWFYVLYLYLLYEGVQVRVHAQKYGKKRHTCIRGLAIIAIPFPENCYVWTGTGTGPPKMKYRPRERPTEDPKTLE